MNTVPDNSISSDKVSIVVPAYNAEKVIGQTLESVLAQTFRNWELVVVDDASKDGTGDVVRSFAARDLRVRLMTLDRNHGAPAGPRNKGVAQATGTWIAFLDADDIWHPRKLELQVNILRHHGGLFACSSMRDFRHSDEIIHDEIIQNEAELVQVQEISFNMQRLKGRIPASSVMLDAKVARAFPFNEDMKYKAVEDYHCWLRILETHSPCLKISAPLLHYRRIEGQISGSKTYMAGRMYHLHRHFPRTNGPMAAFYTLSHLIGATYFRFIKREL